MIGKRINWRISWILVASALCGCSAGFPRLSTQLKKTNRLESDQYMAIGQLFEEQGRSSKAQTMYRLAGRVPHGSSKSIAPQRTEALDRHVARRTEPAVKSVYSTASALRRSATRNGEASAKVPRQKTRATAVSLTKLPAKVAGCTDQDADTTKIAVTETASLRQDQSLLPRQSTPESNVLPLWKTSPSWPASVTTSTVYEQPAHWPRLQSSPASVEPASFAPAASSYPEFAHRPNNSARNHAFQPIPLVRSFSTAVAMPVVIPARKPVP